MLENFAFPQLEEEKVKIFLKDRAQPHYGNIVHDAFNDRFPGEERPNHSASESTRFDASTFSCGIMSEVPC
jgi:hypothetical protein